ncbi:type IV pilus biogenesis protein PilM [Nesterenkonia sp. NBAIMH1]|uniref:type IV pilus biogenesis protein PilM n=1 Tax=Nesterenkonia sp. NBAIMH1 TaxID=2600320 RepID=UPI0011B43F52|nr:pilus assembly protein PilM [Nesterenkonia sp. NBAIMH1]
MSPLKAPERVVGIDFGTSSVRGVEVTTHPKKGPQVRRFARIALPSGAVEDGEVMEPNTVGDALKRLWEKGSFSTNKVALGVGNQRVLVRPFTVDDQPASRVREALPALVEEILPFRSEDALIDFYPIERHPNDAGRVNGLVVAAAKHAIDEAVRAIRIAKLRTHRVDLIPFALSRVHLWGEYSNGTIALIYQAPSSTTVLIATNRVPRFVRIIPAGDEDVTAHMEQVLGLGHEELTAELATRPRAQDPSASTRLWGSQRTDRQSSPRHRRLLGQQHRTEDRHSSAVRPKYALARRLRAIRRTLRRHHKDRPPDRGFGLHDTISAEEMRIAAPSAAIGLAMGGESWL